MASKKRANDGDEMMQPFNAKTLQELTIAGTDDVSANLLVKGICSDSRQVKPGDLFVARDGVAHRGIDFIAQAAKAGAVAAIVDQHSYPDLESFSFSIPVFKVRNLAQKVSGFAAQMLDNPSSRMTVIGITGTNGKTSCAHYVAQALNALGIRTAIIGTVGNGFPEALEQATHTTPDAIRLQQLLAAFEAQGAKAVVMEVSSHALDQGRVAGVMFDVVAMTNLSRDHLDYHGSMDAYAHAKARLFTEFDVKQRVLNLDDDYVKSLAEKLQKGSKDTMTFSLYTQADVYATSCLLSREGIQLSVNAKGEEHVINLPVIGAFNASNILLMLSVLRSLDMPFMDIVGVASQISAVPGRMEVFAKEGMPTVVVDYAHTPDALEKALLAAREHCQATLWVVFGCGGDRDIGKRAEMARAAEAFADKVVVTSDNPRTEAPEEIIDMIISGFKEPAAVTRCVDREEAILWALGQAEKNDLVVIAGKGHEDYQEIMNVKYPFSDKAVVMGYQQREAHS